MQRTRPVRRAHPLQGRRFSSGSPGSQVYQSRTKRPARPLRVGEPGRYTERVIFGALHGAVVYPGLRFGERPIAGTETTIGSLGSSAKPGSHLPFTGPERRHPAPTRRPSQRGGVSVPGVLGPFLASVRPRWATGHPERKAEFSPTSEMPFRAAKPGRSHAPAPTHNDKASREAFGGSRDAPSVWRQVTSYSPLAHAPHLPIRLQY